MRYLIVCLPPLLVYGSAWLYGRLLKQSKAGWKRMEARADANKKIATQGDKPEPPEPESLAVYAVGREW